tara:strand:+ start:238 stop:498 length:261 start_codon:yes stop_codon:yes gene_type:complete
LRRRRGAAAVRAGRGRYGQRGKAAKKAVAKGIANRFLGGEGEERETDRDRETGEGKAEAKAEERCGAENYATVNFSLSFLVGIYFR